MSIVKRDGTVEMPVELAAALLDLACYPPTKHGVKTTYGAKVPWRWVDDVRAQLDALGYDWRKVHNTLHRKEAT